MKYKVKLTYFRQSGKYYSEGKYVSEKNEMFEIFREVRLMLTIKRLPELVDGHSDYIVHVDVPEHPNNYPALILPK